MRNKVILECNHESCLSCVISFMKASNKPLSCPTCRKKYNDIYINNNYEDEEEVTDLYNDQVCIIRRDGSFPYADILKKKNPDLLLAFYDTYVLYDRKTYKTSFVIIHPQVERNIIEELLEFLVRQVNPYRKHLIISSTAYLKEMKKKSERIGEFTMSHYPHHLEDFTDTIIEKIENIYM